jgi:lipoprotein-anchoring transpeptidase ErfK/SrfK
LLAGAVTVSCALLPGCGSDETETVAETQTTTVTEESAPAKPAKAGGPNATDAPGPVEAGRPLKSILSLETPRNAYPVVWVRAGEEVEIRTEPGGSEVAKRVDRQTEFGSPSVFGVVRRSGDWAAVTTPYLANGQLGWVRLDASKLDSGWTKRSIVVDLSERRAELRTGDEVTRSFVVTVGMPGAETPTGRFAVTDTFRGDLNAAYGCCAVAISANQPHLPSGWFGGSRIAFHGTSGPLGVAASHGCVRASDPDVNALVNKVPLGTPVFIRA